MNFQNLPDQITRVDASYACNVSIDTLRRWQRLGHIRTTRAKTGIVLIETASLVEYLLPGISK